MSCDKKPFAPFPTECPTSPEIEPNCQEQKCIHFKYKAYDIFTIEQPLVSILMPYYNCAETCGKAIESIINQTYSNWELVIVNDGGDDFIYDCYLNLTKFNNYNNIIYHKQANHGQAHARNKAYTLSSGMFIAYLDADDEWMPDHLEQSLLKLFEGYHIVYGNFTYKIYHDSKYYENLFASCEIKEHVYPEGIVGHESDVLQKENFIANHTVVHDRRLFVLAGGFEEGVVCGEDGVLWRRMTEINAKFGFVDKPTTYYCRYDQTSILGNYHQSKQLHMPEKVQGIHLIGNGTNGQELDIQETYIKRVEMLKPFAEPKSKLINYIGKVDKK